MLNYVRAFFLTLKFALSVCCVSTLLGYRWLLLLCFIKEQHILQSLLLKVNAGNNDKGNNSSMHNEGEIVAFCDGAMHWNISGFQVVTVILSNVLNYCA